MKRTLSVLIFFISSTFLVQAQQAVVPVYQEYGKVDTADLTMKDCDFEKGADAEVLFDKGINDQGFLTRHVRIKIFNTAGLNQANVRIEYYSPQNEVDGFKAETINLNDGNIEITPIDKKQVYVHKVDNFTSELVFALPNVRPGSIIEYKYHIISNQTWYFQSGIPTRCSEIQASFSGDRPVNFVPHVFQSFAKNVGSAFDVFQDKTLYNIPSLSDEPFMSSRKDNLERMENIQVYRTVSSWETIADIYLKFNDFGEQFNRGLTGEEMIIKKARALTAADDKIAFIFNYVKNNMRWDSITTYGTKDGTSEAWDKKTGNSAEINIILYHLLKKTGINVNPLMISTKENGQINPFNINPYCFNNVVVYIPIDTTNVSDKKYYVLDATSKYNIYNQIPNEYLNTFGLVINKSDNYYKMIFLEDQKPITQSVFVIADIHPDGKMAGSARITEFGYHKTDDNVKYKTDGEKKFVDGMADNDNNLKISGLQLENMDIDSLPLIKKFSFAYDLAGSDDNYIYFNSNLFFTPRKNPFLSEARFTDVDFKFHEQLLISGIFKIPAGYTIDALPKGVVMMMPDSSISFNRTVSAKDGIIVLHYAVNYKKTLFFKENYADLYEFYKKMYAMLNEQIVLKKV